MRQAGLKKRVMTYVALSVLIVGVCATWFGVHFLHTYQVESLIDRGKLITQMRAQALAGPMWELNTERVKELVKFLREDKDFYSAEVIEADDDVVAYFVSETAQPSDLVFTAPIIQRSPDDQASQLLGHIKVTLSRDRLVEQQRQTVLFGIVISIIIMAVVMATLYGVLIMVVANPLQHMLETIQRITQGDLHKRLDAPATREFSELAVAFNKMTSDLSLHTEKLEERSKALEVTVEALEAAKDLAESANQTKSQFLATISHELRTPLNAIIGYGEMLAEDLDTMSRDEVVSDLNKITTSGKHLLSLINDVLDVSKLEAGKMSIYLESVNLYEVVREVTTMTRPCIEKNGNVLEVSLPPDLPQMTTDVTKLRQIMANLLTNAGKFTAQGKIHLSMAIKTRNEESFIEISVKDTGIGMNKEQVDRIFQAFTQADTSTTRRFGGFGLGLTITKEYCHLLAGTIHVLSEPGMGAEFIVHLPLLSTTHKSPGRSGSQTDITGNEHVA
ncbi:MAG: sensor histidine kinase [Holosporales bacterium]